MNPRVANCTDCSVGITAQSKTGRCRSCANRAMSGTPQHRRKNSEGQRRRMADPAFRAFKRSVLRKNQAKGRANPETNARLIQSALDNLAKAFTPEAITLKRKRAKAAFARRMDPRVAWCPAEYREMHRRNVVSKRMPAAESRRLIEAMIAENPPTFEAKLKAVAEGRLTISANLRVPSRQYEWTLGGVGW